MQSVTTHPLATLKQTANELHQRLGEFDHYLQQAEILQAYAYALPDIPQGQEHEPIEHITPERLCDAAALSRIRESYQQLYARTGCSTKATLRLPGFIRLPSVEQKALHRQLIPINRLKQEFKQCVLALGDKNRKFELVHQALPGAITLQFYRQLILITDSVQTLGFTWANKQSIRKITRDQLLKQLERSRLCPPHQVDSELWARQVAREMHDIAKLSPDTPLRVRRPVKTHPMINLRWQDKEPRQQQFKAHLPLILCLDHPPRLSHLGHYPPLRIANRTDRLTHQEPLIERLHVYLHQA